MSDLRLAVRALLASRLVSALAAVTLALAIGASTAVFSLVNTLLLRPLPVADPDRLVTISSDFAISHGFTAGAGWSHAMWDALRRHAGAFDGACAWQNQTFTAGRGTVTESVKGMYVSGEFFTTVGVPALHGRVLNVGDDVPGGGPAGLVGVITYRFWQRRFGRAPDAIGSTLLVDGVPVTVIGVTPRSFLGLEVGQPVDVLLPIGAEPVIRGAESETLKRRSFLLLVMLRLKRDQSMKAATDVLRSLQAPIVPSEAPAFVKEPFTLVSAVGGPSGPTGLRPLYARPLLTMLGGVALVLLIACVNVANLLLARVTARQRDLSVRAALGASRWGLTRQLMIESAILSATGALGGLLLAMWGARSMVALASAPADGVDLSIDWRILLFTTLLAIAAAQTIGIVPALRAARASPAAGLRIGAGVAGGHAAGVSGALVVVQVALTLVVVIAAGLLTQTFGRLARLPLGFDADRVVVVNVGAARAERRAGARLLLFQRLADAAGRAPGVAHAAASLWTPLTGEGALVQVDIPGGEPNRAQVNVLANFVTPRWFAVYGTPLKAGRDFTAADTEAAPRVVVVNEAFVRRFLPNQPAIGATIFDNQSVVGVVGDAVYRTSQRLPGVASAALREPAAPTVYVPLSQLVHWDRPPATNVRVSARSTTASPRSLIPGLGATLAAVDPHLEFTFRLVADDVSAALGRERLLAGMSAGFAVLSLLLATLGLYGVTSYSTARRRTEIGVRIAIGATPANVTAMIVAGALKLVGAGIVLGVIGGVLLTRTLSGMLFGITPLDPLTFAGLSALMAAVGVVAAYIPAHRASRADPVRALRLA